MMKLMIFLIVGGQVVFAATGRFLHQTEAPSLLPSTPFTTADPPILVNAPLAESSKNLMELF
jgi:hypothetical protein